MRNKATYSSSGKTGMDKANKFVDTVKPHGWECSVEQLDGPRIHCFARRGENETIDIWWVGEKGAITVDFPPLYTLAGERIKLLNVSACVNIATKPADMSRLTKAIKKTRKPRKSAELPGLTASLSDDGSATLAETLDAKIQAAPAILGLCGMDDRTLRRTLIDQTIEWVNGQSGMTQAATVNSIKKIVRNGHDYVEFTDRDGFHAVYIDRIVSIG